MADNKTQEFENRLLDHIFLNAAIADIGSVGAGPGLPPSVSEGNLYISLHTAVLTDAADQSTSEATYTGYSTLGRIAVPRNGTYWEAGAAGTSGRTQNLLPIVFSACTAGGPETIRAFGIGTDATGTGHLLYWGTLSATLDVSAGITPQFAAGDLTVAEL